ncbi:MAG: cation-transporting P-type ATPase, partial [Mycobacterium sp.]|nr:cation-transporting P-type ATPase [Mycobacterium sp.]
TLTAMALGLGIVAAGLIEVIWWVQGAVVGERRRLWRSSED